MPSIVTTMKREDTTKPWFQATPRDWNETGLFSQEEIDNILIVDWQNITSMPGYVGVSEVIEDKTLIKKLEFDTIPHCADALRYILDSTPGSLPKIKRELLAQKRIEYGVSYDFDIKIEN